MSGNYETSIEFQLDFLMYLKSIVLNPMHLITFVPKNNNTQILRSNHYYDILSFKVYMCELIYNAIRLFPDIIEYTIKVNESILVIGFLNEIDKEGERCLAKITNKLGTFPLTKQCIHDLYLSNRSKDVDEENINSLLAMLFLDSVYPKITTSYISLPSKTKY